ncbi:MAG: beta-propeller fold lactonase family protein [Gammaproteobacteria bacterium]|nr:beta-propeller fold lactonase family protein [Gammaproteobacteria bacterium]MDH5652798.1 beta-propeller fold lactonase family protein [Gammaproteobacteria bacterium]
MLALCVATLLVLSACSGVVQRSDQPVEPTKQPGRDAALEALEQGKALQQSHQTEAAILAYKKALQLKENYAEAHYELGWSYWIKGDWEQVIKHWEIARDLKLQKPQFADYLVQAGKNLEGKADNLVRVEVGATAAAADGSLRLALSGRYQRYNPNPVAKTDFYDTGVRSPKSVQFHPTKNKVYVNSLEGAKTVVYDSESGKKLTQINHVFNAKNAALFATQQTYRWMEMPADISKPYQFTGKPVEQTFSPDGKYIWVPYYRRSYDELSTLPSALALIDTDTDKIIRMFDTGPIPKYVTASSDGKWLAVTHWGDNTVGLIKTEGEPTEYKYDKLIVIGSRVRLDKIKSADRDHGCGLCLRGSVFSKDNKYLFIARMGGGGIAVIDVLKKRYIGSIFGMPHTPRHLLLSPDGNQLYLSSNMHGSVSKYNVADIVKAVKKKQRQLKPLVTTRTGSGTRTISISPDGKYIFAAVNKESRVVALQAADLAFLFQINADSYPVGMDISPDGKQLWVTAQGRKGRGGDSVMVYSISSVPAGQPDGVNVSAPQAVKADTKPVVGKQDMKAK